MIYSPDNLKYCLGSPRTAFVGFCQRWAGEHFRLVSLAMAGPAAEPCYSAVMVKSARPFRTTRPELRQGGRAMTSIIVGLAADPAPLYPYLIAATGDGAGTVYAAAFREMDEAPVFDLSMSADAFAQKNEEQRALGRMLLSVDAFGTAGAVRYCAIWGANPTQLTWSAQAVNDMAEADQERYEVLTSIWARPALIQMTPGGGMLRLYVDDRLKHGRVSRPSMSRAQLDDELRTQADAGFYPISIGMNRIGRVDRFAALFAKSDEIKPRAWRVNGPEPIGLTAADLAKTAQLDDWVENFVKTHNLRGAAFAVVKGTRLVYAKGYSWAESGYPEVEPTTLFRLASLSKTFCAVAVWKLMGDLLLTIPMQSLLHLRQPDGSAPADPDFASITIRQLLESESGINQNAARSCVATNRDDGGSQPLTAAEVAKLVAGRDMPNAPGAVTYYGNTDYFLLAQVAAKLAGKTEFEAALREAVLDPLHMTRTRNARSALDLQRPEDVRQHSNDLATYTSCVHEDFRLVPMQYGAENYEVYSGAGGLSAAVVDVARLCAMFSCRTGNPVLGPDRLDAMFDAAVTATQNGSGPEHVHGYHGFDGAGYEANGGKAAHHVTVHKGGSLPGVRTGFQGTTGRCFGVLLRNGQAWPNKSSGDWTVHLIDIAESIDWGNGDLFPHFGMPPLGVGAAGPGPVVKAGLRLRPK